MGNTLDREEFLVLDVDERSWPQVLPGRSSINLLHLAEVMNKVANFLERLSWPISQGDKQTDSDIAE